MKYQVGNIGVFVSESHLKEILPEFQAFLRDRRLVSENNIPEALLVQDRADLYRVDRAILRAYLQDKEDQIPALHPGRKRILKPPGPCPKGFLFDTKPGV